MTVDVVVKVVVEIVPEVALVNGSDSSATPTSVHGEAMKSVAGKFVGEGTPPVAYSDADSPVYVL